LSTPDGFDGEGEHQGVGQLKQGRAAGEPEELPVSDEGQQALQLS